MNNELLLRRIMSTEYYNNLDLTICGSARNRELKEKYQAYYTIKNNCVHAPINYLLIKNEVETSEDETNRIIKTMQRVHFKKIDISDAIIVVTGNDGYYGSDTKQEVDYAKRLELQILFTHVKEEDKHKYYFNGDEKYPLYIIKEEFEHELN